MGNKLQTVSGFFLTVPVQTDASGIIISNSANPGITGKVLQRSSLAPTATSSSGIYANLNVRNATIRAVSVGRDILEPNYTLATVLAGTAGQYHIPLIERAFTIKGCDEDAPVSGDIFASQSVLELPSCETNGWVPVNVKLPPWCERLAPYAWHPTAQAAGTLPNSPRFQSQAFLPLIWTPFCLLIEG